MSAIILVSALLLIIESKTRLLRTSFYPDGKATVAMPFPAMIILTLFCMSDANCASFFLVL